MVHTIGGSLSGIGSGLGGMFTGLAPVPIYGAIISHAHEPVSGALKRAGKEIGGKKMSKKKIKKTKAKKKSKKR